MARYLKKSHPEISGSFGLRGGLSMMSKSGGLKPRAVAGSPSVTRLTHSSWTGISASGRPRMAVRKMLQGGRKKADQLRTGRRRRGGFWVLALTTRLLPRWRRWGIWWTASCCCRWLCPPRRRPQWWRSCHRTAPSPTPTWPLPCRNPWRCRFRPSLGPGRRSHRLLSELIRTDDLSLITALNEDEKNLCGY